MNAKHTPGAWYTLHPEDGMIVHEETGNTIARCVWARDYDDYEANARIIAAAPDLLAACEWAARSEHHLACPVSTGTSLRCECHVEACRAAIAKATGGNAA